MGWTNLSSKRKKIIGRAESKTGCDGWRHSARGYMGGTVENSTAVWRDHDKLEEWLTEAS